MHKLTIGMLRERWAKIEAEVFAGSPDDQPVRDLIVNDVLEYLFPSASLKVRMVWYEIDDDLNVLEPDEQE